MKKIFLFICFRACAAFGFVSAQDVHFSQFFNAPLLLNPANTAVIPHSDIRGGINYRMQQLQPGNALYRTMQAWGEIKLFDKRPNSWLGAGMYLYNDRADHGVLVNNRVTVSAAYHQMLGLGSLISAGFSYGYYNQRLSYEHLTFEQQWNSLFFDPDRASGEVFEKRSNSYYGVSGGLRYSYFGEKTEWSAGISVLT